MPVGSRDGSSQDEWKPLLVHKTEGAKFPNKSLLLATFAACIGGSFQYGYNISVINAATVHVQAFINQTWQQRYQTDITKHGLTFLWSTIVSAFTLGGLIGASVGGAWSVTLGRKGTLLVNNTFVLTAALLMGLSYPTGIYEFLIAGRFLCGIQAGVATCVEPLYLGEIAPTALRGITTMGTCIFLTGGILTGQVMGLREFLKKDWYLLLSTTCIPAFLQLLLLPCFPESPRFLLIDRGDTQACILALRQLGGTNNIEGQREEIEKERTVSLGKRILKPCELLAERSLGWQLLTVVLLNAAQQLSGINTIYLYADYVYRAVGIPEDEIPLVTVGSGACECLAALTCGLLVERVGRRALIVGGYTLMMLCCFSFTLALTFHDSSPVAPYVSVVCVFAFILSFSFGPGGVTNILTTELFTQNARPAAYTIASTVNWSSFFIITITFPFIVLELHQYCFLFFLVVCALMSLYIFFVVPETKNKTFLEIQCEFRSRRVQSGIDESQQELLLNHI